MASVAHELTKLHALLEKGAITQDEYDKLKNELINRPDAPEPEDDQEVIGNIEIEVKKPSAINMVANALWKLTKLIFLVLFLVVGFLYYIGWKGDSNKSPADNTETHNAQPQSQKTKENLELLNKAANKIGESMKDPRKVRMMECMGVDVWKEKPDGWTAPTAEECAALKAELGVNESSSPQ